MITLVCGGRGYANYDLVSEALYKLPFVPSIVIQGGAKGADSLAFRWARENGIHSATVATIWDLFGLSAGNKRNSAMLILQPGYCVAFPGGGGTQDMVKQCEAAGVVVWRPYGR